MTGLQTMTTNSDPLAVPPEPPPPPIKPARVKKAWGDPILKLDIVLTRFETVLCVVVLAAEVLALTLWVALKGLSTAGEGGSAAGVVFRALFGATALGMLAWQLCKKQPEKLRVVITLVATFVGLFSARAWANFGVNYTSNLLNWYQQASVLTLFGGLRGIGTRLTLLLSILGGSLATARGKHITIDLVQRFASEKIRVPVVVFGWVASAFISAVLAWGFFDHISIESFGAKPHASVGEKFGAVMHELDEGFFITRKQLSLDLRSTLHVAFKGEAYSDWLKGSEWNEWLDGAGFKERYGAEAIEQLKVQPDDLRAPMVIIPGRGEPRGELISAANLVYPFGFLVIAIRFIIRSLLAMSGHVSVDPDDSGEFSTDDDELEGAV
jgi:TRAP-type C4-dicarboxylate transport system permease small subunit